MRHLTLAEEFESFDTENPHIFVLLVTLARTELRSPGVRCIGIGKLFEQLRWESAVASSTSEFKLNNSFRAFYVRKLECECPDLTGAFRTRRSGADDWAAAKYGRAA